MTSQSICLGEIEQHVMIEYPGFVVNPDKALATLGGLESIEKVFESQKDRLELKFRQFDPLSHAAYGDRTAKKCLVLRIKKRYAKKQTTSTQQEKLSDDTKQNDEFEVSVVGKLQTSFRFETLAEFQWLPMQRTNCYEKIKTNQLQEGLNIERTFESLNPEYISILDEAIPIRDPFDNTLKNFNPDAPLLILPAVFSRFDSAREIHQPHPKFRSKEMREEFERQQKLAIIGRTRKKRTTMSYLINFSDSIPLKPPEKLISERLNILSPMEKSLIPRLERCFRDQKVWSKAALCYDLKCTTLDIKYILPLIAFHYLNGPFRTMWVSYGYDPHKDVKSKIYQTLDFRVKNPNDGQQEYSKRSLHSYQIPMRKNVDKTRNTQQVDLKSIISSSQATSSSSYDESMDDPFSQLKNFAPTEAMCKFRKDLVPIARQLSYQLNDIEIVEVQEIVHANDGKEPAECSEKDGWLLEGSIDKIRKIMTKTLNETIDKMSLQLAEGTS